MTILYHNMILEENTDEDKIWYRILWVSDNQEVMYISH